MVLAHVFRSCGRQRSHPRDCRADGSGDVPGLGIRLAVRERAHNRQPSRLQDLVQSGCRQFEAGGKGLRHNHVGGRDVRHRGGTDRGQERRVIADERCQNGLFALVDQNVSDRRCKVRALGQRDPVGLAARTGHRNQVGIVEDRRKLQHGSRDNRVFVIGKVPHDLARCPFHRCQLLGESQTCLNLDPVDEQPEDIVVQVDMPVAQSRLKLDVLLGQGAQDRIPAGGVLSCRDVLEAR